MEENIQQLFLCTRCRVTAWTVSHGISRWLLRSQGNMFRSNHAVLNQNSRRPSGWAYPQACNVQPRARTRYSLNTLQQSLSYPEERLHTVWRPTKPELRSPEPVAWTRKPCKCTSCSVLRLQISISPAHTSGHSSGAESLLRKWAQGSHCHSSYRHFISSTSKEPPSQK